MANTNQEKAGQLEQQIRHLERENRRLQRTVASYETQLQTLDKTARAKEKINTTLQSELDILSKRVEKQVREARIEAALERVRARAMAMHRSEELPEVATVMFREFQALTNIETGTGSGCWISIIDTENEVAENWGTDFEGGTLPVRFRLPQTMHPVLAKNYEAWKRGEPFIVTDLSREAFIDFTQYISRLPDFATDPVIQEALANPPERYFQYEASFSHGVVGIGSVHKLETKDTDILLRFAKVFDLTYRRFLDLKQAEEQAREAQIEAALERVRASTMAMHQSDELRSVIATVFEQLKELGFEAPACGLIIFRENGDAVNWLSGFGKETFPVGYHIPHIDHPYYQAWLEAWKAGEPWKDFVVEGDLKRSFDEHLFQHSDFKDLSAEIKNEFRKIDRAVSSNAFMRHGMLGILANEPIAEEQKNIIRRFAKVFDQTYTRFLDLQKAEERAREAQIEAALERVRARTMAMHRSDELMEVAAVLFQQLDGLDIFSWRCGIGIFDAKKRIVETWSVTTSNDVTQVQAVGQVELMGHPVGRDLFAAWKNRDSLHVYDLSGEALKDYFSYVTRTLPLPEGKISPESLPKRLVYYHALFTQGTLYGVFSQPLPETQLEVLQRFARVFEQTYTRFLDLKQAEEQAREAQIEAGLERVRAKAMAMHRSDDLASAVATVFAELDRLGLKTLRCGIGIFNIVTRKVDFWTTASTDEGRAVQVAGDAMMAGHALLEGVFEAWQHQRDYSYILQGEDLARFYEVMADSNFQLPASAVTTNAPTDALQFYHCAMFPAGGLYAFRENEFSEHAVQLMRRFAEVFHLTFTRHQDLVQAEARAREAEQQASLDRVRAEIASMRTAGDLQRITPLIWRELTTLGVPFFRCGVFIIDEVAEQAHVYLSTPFGKPLAALQLKSASTPLVEQIIRCWQQGEVYRNEWDRQRFKEWTQSMLKEGFIDSPEQYQAGEEVPEKLVIQLVPFTQGMLYVGSQSPLSDAEIDLMKMLSEAFAVAYARYEDFQRLEAAKAEIETAFSELGLLSKELEAKNKELEAENLRKARELEDARRLQLAMLPKNTPMLPHLDIAVYMQTATEVGGDYYDFKLEKDGTLTAAIGDATGHGLQAGTMVATAKGLFNSLAHDPDPVQILQKSSIAIKAMGFSRLYMAMMIAKFKDGQLKIAAAGMPYALIYRARSDRVEEVVLKGMPLGSFPDFRYQQKTFRLNAGDTVLFRSDGLEERLNGKGETLGEKQVKTLFAKAGREPLQQIIAHLKLAGEAWAGTRPPADDVTMVVMRMK